MVPLKQYYTQSRISPEGLKQCSLNLAPEMNLTKERKWHPACRCHDNCYAAGTVLIKTKILRFKDHQLPTIWCGGLRQYENHVCSEQEPLSENGIFGFSQKEAGVKSVAMATLWAKRYCSLLWKAFQIISNYFLTSSALSYLALMAILNNGNF